MSDACPMIARCAERQDPDTMISEAAMYEPFPIVLWDAYVQREQHPGAGGAADGPAQTWAMALK